MHEVIAPWAATMTDTQRSLVEFALVAAGLALLAMLVRTWTSREEVSGRYRPAVSASLAVLTVAFASYVVLIAAFLTGYDRVGQVWVPNEVAQRAWSTRYMDWVVTVPLLVVELLAVSSLYRGSVTRARAVGITAAVLMILTGYVGGVAVGGGEDFGALLGWGLASSACFAVLYVLVLVVVLRSLPALPGVARPAYRGAMILLLSTWGVYPIVFGLQGVTAGGAWAATGQLLLCAADVLAKVGFGLLIHRVAKMRTAFDVQAGLDTHPETLWIDGERHSDALQPASYSDPRADSSSDLAEHR